MSFISDYRESFIGFKLEVIADIESNESNPESHHLTKVTINLRNLRGKVTKRVEVDVIFSFESLEVFFSEFKVSPMSSVAEKKDYQVAC